MGLSCCVQNERKEFENEQSYTEKDKLVSDSSARSSMKAKPAAPPPITVEEVRMRAVSRSSSRIFAASTLPPVSTDTGGGEDGAVDSYRGGQEPTDSTNRERETVSTTHKPAGSGSNSNFNAPTTDVDPKNAFKLRATALWDFTGDEDYDQLAFRTGDVIIVMEEDTSSGWWWGELNGKEGYFPVNYTEVKKPEIKVSQESINPKIRQLQQQLVAQT